MTTSEKQVPSKGAMRAAQSIGVVINRVVCGVMCGSPDPTSDTELAEIIDRETQAPAMVEALKDLLFAGNGNNFQDADEQEYAHSKAVATATEILKAAGAL